jgi:EAL domain-containing protein (putative c-di-GMP-specific phosphodiesterase class I)
MYRNSFRLTNTEIDEAFASRQFRLVFQPKVDLQSNALAGVEAFARWQHPQIGVIPPALFLPVLAQQGRNQELTRFVLADTIQMLNRQSSAQEPMTVSVNVAPDELADGSLPVSIRLALTAADLDPARLVIDLPERGLAANPERARDTIHALRQIGVTLALECAPEPLIDLSAGADAPVDLAAFGELKIGGQAIIQFATRLEGTGLGLLNKRLAFARDAGIKATAVGAETAESLSALRRLGFDQVQGNAISTPLNADDVPGFNAADRMAELGNSPQPKTEKAAPADELPHLAPEKPQPQPRIQVVRGKAKVELMTQGKEGAPQRVFRLSIPKPDATNPGRMRDQERGQESFMSRLQSRLARSLHL